MRLASLFFRSSTNMLASKASRLPTCQHGISFETGSMATHVQVSPIIPLPRNASGTFISLRPTKDHISSTSIRGHFRAVTCFVCQAAHASPVSNMTRETVFFAAPVIRTVERRLQPSTRQEMIFALSVLSKRFTHSGQLGYDTFIWGLTTLGIGQAIREYEHSRLCNRNTQTSFRENLFCDYLLCQLTAWSECARKLA